MKKLAPYQILFPIGIFCSLLAVGVWFVQELNWFSSPTLFIHSRLIIGGFLWSFILGFLMTAVPKMTGTNSATGFELNMAVLFLVLQISFSWMIDIRWFYLNQMLLVFFMMLFGGKRLLQSQRPLPVFFSHISLAMVLALIGVYYHYTGSAFMGIHLFHVGTILLLVLGIGTRFFSFLSGLPSEFENASKNQHFIFHALGVLTAVSLFLAGLKFAWAYLGLSIISMAYLLLVWRVFRKSARPSALKYGVRIVALMIPLSFFMCWIQPTLYITWFHLLFIGCFSLITYSVATRVTLAHGAYSTDLELKSPALKNFIILLILTIVSRVFYGMTEGNWRKSFLHLAATFWIFAILVWSKSFAKRILVTGDQQSPSC